MDTAKLIEIHMIQNHSPANLNRDDLGAPKTCVFGGVTRARISSQCLKRSIRNPGNPDDIHNREPGYFAREMIGYIGTRTKLFPWLVGRALDQSSIPRNEHRRIVMAAQRIATAKEKDQPNRPKRQKADKRPMTPQLIHLGPAEAGRFVQELWRLRGQQKEQYDYFLNPIVGFRDLVRLSLAGSSLDEKEQEKIAKASWVIAKCRMQQLLGPQEGEEETPEPPLDGDQPGLGHAELIAEHLIHLKSADPERYKALTKAASKKEKAQLKEEAPPKPAGGMGNFNTELMASLQGRSVDVALFGRMTTSDAFQDVEAAMQVAHAISTHEVTNKVDYFTAVDDLSTGPGAGHVGEAQFASACFYKYVCLDWDQLVDNLAGPEPQDPGPKARKNEREAYRKAKEAYPQARNDAEKLAAATLGHFLIAAATTNPSGKQNSFAAHNLPDGILVEIKDRKSPTSYANAFAEPARRIGMPDDDAPDEVSLVGRSIAQLGDYVYSLRQAYNQSDKDLPKLLWYSPRTWRYPLRGWEREPDGRKKRDDKGKEQPPDPLTDKRYHCVQGRNEKDCPTGLVDAVLHEIGFRWPDVRDAGKAHPQEARP